MSEVAADTASLKHFINKYKVIIDKEYPIDIIGDVMAHLQELNSILGNLSILKGDAQLLLDEKIYIETMKYSGVTPSEAGYKFSGNTLRDLVKGAAKTERRLATIVEELIKSSHYKIESMRSILSTLKVEMEKTFTGGVTP